MRRLRLVFSVSLTLVMGLVVPRLAGADASHVTVRWTAPAPCPDENTVKLRVTQLVTSPDTMEVDATVTCLGDGFHLSLHVRGAHWTGERVLDAPSCDVLAESAAVIVALGAVTASPRGPTRAADEFVAELRRIPHDRIAGRDDSAPPEARAQPRARSFPAARVVGRRHPSHSRAGGRAPDRIHAAAESAVSSFRFPVDRERGHASKLDDARGVLRASVG